MAGYIGNKAVGLSVTTGDILGDVGVGGNISVTTSDGAILNLNSSDSTITDGSVLGAIKFTAPDEASGTDAILVGAAIEAVAEGTFAADNNATELVFKTGASAAADAKMTLTSGGDLLLSGGVFLGGTGSANKLSDYEEGLMTATLTADSGTITVSSANDILNYIKIGGFVSLTGRIRTSAVSSPSGKVKLNLPFVIADLAEDSNRASGTLYLQNGTGAINTYGIHPTSDANQYIEIGRIDGTAFDLQIGDEFDGNELLYFSIQYRAA